MAHYYLIAPSTMVRADEPAFTYQSDTPLALGTLVRVSVGKRTVNGVVIQQVTQKPSFATKPVESVIAPQPLPSPLIALAQWLSDYYATHLATVLQTVLPAGLHKIRRITKNSANHPSRARTKIVLNKEQSAVLARLHTG